MTQKTWDLILSKLATGIDAHRFDTWFRPLTLNSSEDSSSITLVAPNQFMCEFLTQHYRDRVIDAARQVVPSIRRVSFCSENGSAPETEPSSDHVAPPSSTVQSTRRHSLNKRFTFDTFVVGSGNEFAKSAASAVAEAPGKTKFNPLLIYGGVGLGKTHLLQAVGNFIFSINPRRRVEYLSSEDFYLDFIDAIKNNNTKQFSEKYRMADVLLIDDVQFFGGKESTQEAFFYIFNSLYQNSHQIVLTSDMPPGSLKGLQDRLISRFAWGLCIDIQPPDLETRVAILKKKAEEDNLNIPEAILYYIAEHVSSNIRELEGIVIRLLAYSSITKSDITIELVKSILNLKPESSSNRVPIDDIIKVVAEYYHVPVNNIREKNRRKEVALCRQIAMFITKTLTNHSLKTIGLHFGGRDHSTVIHSINQVEKLKESDASINQDINYIISQLNA